MVNDLQKQIPSEWIQYVNDQILNMQRPVEQILLDEADAIAYLKVTRRTLANWREQGKIRFSKLGGKIYYKLSDILEDFERNKNESVTRPKF